MPSYYSGTKVTREQSAQLLYTAGFSGDDLVKMVAIAGRESSYDIGAHRTDSSRSALSGDRGLWQINSTHDAGLIQAGIIKNKADLFDATTNARAAMWVYKQQGLNAWAMGSNGWQGGGDPLKNTNYAAAKQAVDAAIRNGTLTSDAMVGTNTTTTTASAGTLPSDTKLLRKGNKVWAVYDLGSGVFIHYGVDEATATKSGIAIQNINDAEWRRRFPGSVNGGNVAEIVDIRKNFGSYNAFFKSVLDQTISTANPARYDPGVLKVLAEYAGRPDMSEAELNNKLQATSWYQQHTTGQLEWNGLSAAEKESRRQEQLLKMQQTWQQFTGEAIKVTDKRLKTHLENIASGKMGLGTWTEQFVKPRALQNKESPWARQLREEKEEQRRRPIDIENTANQVRQTLDRWGLSWGEASIHKWATNLVEKRSSDDDLLRSIQAQAQTLYPWKDRNVETVTAAQPWLETYNRVMERQATLKTPEVLSAMRNNVDPWAMEQKLKQSSAWLDTNNGQEEMYSTVMSIGQTMGFE